MQIEPGAAGPAAVRLRSIPVKNATQSLRITVLLCQNNPFFTCYWQPLCRFEPKRVPPPPVFLRMVLCKKYVTV